MNVISKLILNSPVVNSLNCKYSASGVRDSFVSFVDYLDVCYKHAAKHKSDVDDYVKVH